MAYTKHQKDFIKNSKKEKSQDIRKKKFVKCTVEVEKKQMHKRKKVNPFAVCRTSTKYKGTTKNIGVRQAFKKSHTPYRFHKRK